jgi:hypothetical protein
MRRTLLALITATALLSAGLAAPAQAARVNLSDPAGDAPLKRLDLTDIEVRNQDHALVVNVSFVRASGGFLLIELKDRAGHRAFISSHHRPQRGDVNSFGTRQGGIQDCAGLQVTWDHARDRAQVRLPSRCYRDGNFGALSTRFFTEVGQDNDFAPNGNNGARWRWSRLIARG